MKKLLLTALLSFVTVGVFAQGVVQFRSFYASSTPPVDARVTLADGTTLLDNSNPLWRAALIGGPTTGTPANVAGGVMGNLALMYNPTTTTLTWTGFRAAPNQGYVAVVNVARQVPGVDWGGTALVQMVAWQGNYTTWADAFAAWQAGTPDVLIGASNPLTLTLPSGPTSPTLTYLTGLNGFSIVPVPEPTTFALAGLGAAALLIFRRRN
jgi:hypothetical protein